MYVLRSLKLNRMYQLITMEVDALVENVQLKSIELSRMLFLESEQDELPKISELLLLTKGEE